MDNLTKIVIIFAIAALSVVTVDSVTCDAEPLQVDAKKLSRLTYPAPENPAAREYLGLPDTKTFSLSQVDADLLLIEVFSMYCPYCQRAAPKVNELYGLIARDAEMRGSVRMIGIGIGNTPYEVEIFRKRYNVPFPLLPDEESAVQKCAGEALRTPTFIAVKMGPKGIEQVVDVHVGAFTDAKEYFEKLKRF